MTANIQHQKIKEGDYCLVVYQDASYAYQVPKKVFSYPKLSKSIGRVRLITKEYLDIGMVWIQNTHTYTQGVVIPLLAIHSIKKLSLYDKK